jgi:hypothetical protein
MGGAVEAGPWVMPNEIVDKQGWNGAIFGYAGAGKTSLAASAPKPCIVDVDGTAARSLLGLNVPVIPHARVDSWAKLEKMHRYLSTQKHPFETICWDTVTSMYKYALQDVVGAPLSAQQPRQNDWGKANALINEILETWCDLARSTGINVLFNVHVKEVLDDEGKLNRLQMDLTPGVLSTMYRVTDTIGYIRELSNAALGTRKFQLLLRSDSKIVAKHHQPQTGSSVIALEHDDPNLSKIIPATRTENTSASNR